MGAHQLAAGSLDLARTHLDEARRFAEEDGSKSGVLLAEGYRIIVDCVEAPTGHSLSSALSDIQSRLRPLEDGEFFADQLTTALEVFAGSGLN